MHEQNDLQNPTFVISKDQTSNPEPETIFSLTKVTLPLCYHFWHLLNQNTMQCNV
jgi:hypothetical protein